MAEHPIQGLMNVTMDKIRQMADSNTIIGKPIKTDDGTTILPVSRISFGFASAGTDFDGKNAANKDLFGGAAGAQALLTHDLLDAFFCHNKISLCASRRSNRAAWAASVQSLRPGRAAGTA